MGRSDERVFPLWFVVMFTLGVGTTLVLLVPREGILDTLDQVPHPTPVTVMFTANLLRHEPSNVQLRLLLARQQTAMGELMAAWQTVHPLLTHPAPDVRRKAARLALTISELEYFGSPTPGTGRERISELIRLLLRDEVDPDLFPSLAESAQAIGDLALARTVYLCLADRARTRADRWFGKAGDLALSEGAYRQAARAYFAAQAHADTLTAQRTYYLKGLEALQAGELLNEALAAAERHLGNLGDDETVLKFLVALGRAAGNGEFAQKYVKRLLRPVFRREAMAEFKPVMEQRGSFRSSFQSAAFESARSPYRSYPSLSLISTWASSRWSIAYPAAEQKRAAAASWRPFDDRIYTLAFDVFVENHNLADAYELAARAVQEAPNHLVWRRRLARVAEWLGRPRVALEQWRNIAERTPDRTALERIRRLAPGLYDDDSLVFAFTQLERHGWLSKEDWREVADAFERLGQPERAVEYLIRRYRDRPDRDVLHHLAALYQRMGDSHAALEIFSQLAETYGLTVPWAIEHANLHIQHGRPEQAYEILRIVQPQAPAETTYWVLLGDLAWLLQDDATAERAYRVLWERHALPRDRIERLITLTRYSDLERAVSICLKEWEVRHEPAFFIRALDLLIHEKHWARAETLLDNLDQAAQAAMVAHHRYWVFRAEIMWNTGQKQEALEAYRRALELRPEDSEIRAAFLWFLIEHEHRDLIETYLRVWRDDLRRDPLLWKPVAAAYLLLDRPVQSLPYFQLALGEDESDYLLLLNYAHALDAASRHAAAWRIRRHVWIDVRQQLLANPQTPVSSELVQAYMEAIPTQEPTEPFLRWIGEHVAERSNPILKEMVASWLLSREEFDAARWWFWTHYASTLERPAWSQLMVALADNDWPAIDAIITQRESELSPHDRIVAATHLQRFPEAQSHAFEAVSDQPTRHDLQSLFREAAMGHAHTAHAQVAIFDRSPLLRYHTQVSAGLNFGRFRLRPFLRFRWQESVDTADLVGVPRIDKWLGGTLMYPFPTGTVALTGFYRHAATGFVGFRFRYERQWHTHAGVSFQAEYNREADDSVVLLVGGVKDELKGEGFYRLSKRQFLELAAQATQFFSQNRDRLGEGVGIEGAIGHRFRTEYPDVSLRLIGQLQRYFPVDALPPSMMRFVPATVTPNIDLVIPNDFEQVGVLVSLGETIRNVQRKGFRLFGSAGANYNSVFGLGHSIEGGISSSLIGRDRLTLSASQLKGGFGKNATTQQFLLQYHSHF